MARKRKSARRRRSGRRMGAVGKANFTAALGIIAGAVIGKKVAAMLPIGDDRIKNAAVTALKVHKVLYQPLDETLKRAKFKLHSPKRFYYEY